MKTALLFVLGSLLVMMAAGCAAREHINPEFGQKNHVFFKKQQVYAEPTQGAPSGLDSEEAAVINASYRKQLGGGTAGGTEEKSRVLLVEPPKERP